jgi:maleylpyruvate isomerase
MWASASRLTDDSCRAASLLPGWSRGHVLAHRARDADGQTRMLLAAMRGKVTAQYPGGDAQREADIETGAPRPAPLILQDVRAALDRVEDAWRRMPPAALASSVKVGRSRRRPAPVPLSRRVGDAAARQPCLRKPVLFGCTGRTICHCRF